MQNKNSLLSFHPTGSPQGSEAREQQISYISKLMQKDASLMDVPFSQLVF